MVWDKNDRSTLYGTFCWLSAFSILTQGKAKHSIVGVASLFHSQIQIRV